jgi:uncharacterized HAD superfamily protein
LRIGIDVDGVLANFVGSFGRAAQKQFGIQINDSTWGLGMTEHEQKQVWAYTDTIPNWWDTLTPYTDALNLRLKLKPDDVVYFITTRRSSKYATVERQTATWLKKALSISMPFVVSASNKGEVCKALKLQAFVDDKPENCQDIADYSDTKVYLLDRPWNQEAKFDRVKNVGEFIDTIRQNG